MINKVSAKRLQKSACYETGQLTYVLLLNCALLTVVRIGHARASADGASALVRAVVTLVTDTNQSARPHVRVAHDTLPVTLLTETTNGWGRKEKG